MLGSLRPTAAPAFEAALVALAACADETSVAGSSMACNYVAGAAGNLRHALACLAAHYGTFPGAADDLEERRVGGAVLLGAAGIADTISGCGLPDGRRCVARALLATSDPEAGVWLRADAAAPNLHVRGRVVRVPDGFAFVDDGRAEAVPAGNPRFADLGSDLLLAGSFDLTTRPAFAAALEVALASGSWVHLASGARWYADVAAAKAIVRALGGVAVSDGVMLVRLGVCVDREVLLAIEALGWRHWPTPGLDR